MTVNQDRLYWTNDITAVINSVDKRTGLDLVSDVAGSANNVLLAFGDNLQPFPGKQLTSCARYVISYVRRISLLYFIFLLGVMYV